MTTALIPGADPWSHVAAHASDAEAPGALILHGFTGNPGSMRGLAEAFAAAGFHVEMPRLPGHGTTVEDMLVTRWADWHAEAEAALQRLQSRTSNVVVAGLSMGGALTLRLGADHPDIAGLVTVNPATQKMTDDVLAVINDTLASGVEVFPSIGSDIADPDQHESAYEATPLRALLSLVHDGLAPLELTYPTTMMPLLLLNSPNDHVVDPVQAEFLANAYGGPVERVTLGRSFHVATQDYDAALVNQSAIDFARRVTGR